MSLSYEVTNWENGKTVLKAEHLRKIEKGITDIISENDALYTDEDTRKSNEINRQNTFSNKISEVNDKITEINNSKENMANAVSNKINEIETKFNELTISKQQDAEVIMARDGETSLKARLDRDIEKTNKELDKIKKLEESTVSTVETESDFTTVEATNGGYFEDVKLEGKTLVNLATLKEKFVIRANSESNSTAWFDPKQNLKAGKVYTLIYTAENVNETVNTLKCRQLGIENTLVWEHVVLPANKGNGIFMFTFEPTEDYINIGFYFDKDMDDTTSTATISNVIIIEGDHTQNPPSYFEGLKSVGQDADEVSVESVKGDGNLFDFTQYTSNANVKIDYVDDNKIILQGISGWYAGVSADFKVKPNTTYLLKTSGMSLVDKSLVACGVKDAKTGAIIHVDFAAADATKLITTISDTISITLKCNNETNNGRVEYTNIMLVEQGNSTEYTPHQSDKKRLLYYNEETQTWEKPILRQWDSIEKHADGKYYYHKRSGEVVLNGSENWRVDTWVSFQVDTICFTYDDKTLLDTGTLKCTSIVDKFKVDAFDVTFNKSDCESYSVGWQQHFIKIQHSKLSTQDVQGFKQGLQANNVTVVYQLPQEKVYECTNIDLITYANETNYVV